jgi:[acyl-carrier-protein] S-malonyltransferase
MSIVFMFPGQGSQKVGMAKDFIEAFESVRKRFDEANSILGIDLKKLILNGPEDDLKATQNTQPALFTVESAINDLLQEKGVIPAYTMGHSLGEYSALFAAGVFSFTDGLKIVAKRGELMAHSGKASKGAMAAVIGLNKDIIKATLAQVQQGCVVCANENAPDQIVISGDETAVILACEKLKAAGAKRVIQLPVSGAFHSPLMTAAAEEFEKFLAPFNFRDAQCPVICNVTAQAETYGAVMKGFLIRQLLSPVRWIDSVATVTSKNVSACIEVGPGNVLRGLVKKCNEQLNVLSCESVDNLYSLAQ